MSFPRYPKYKASGVEWLGEVPEHWEVTPVNAVSKIVNGYPFDSGGFNNERGLPLVRIRDLGRTTTEVLYHGESTPQAHITNQDVLIGMDGDFNVGRFLGEGIALLNQRMCCVRGSTPDLTRLLEYALPIPLNAINAVTFSTTVKHLASSQVAKIRFGVPPPHETSAILAFLDRETAKIDGLVAEQQRLIELLKEKRQAVISHAVTKGLDPKAPMKPSGVEWLGDVPAHWEVKRIAALFGAVAECGAPDLPILSVSIHDGVSDKEMSEDEMDRKVTRSEDRSKYVRVARGDLVYNMMRAWQGAFGTVTTEGMVSPAYVVARPRTACETRFVELLLRTPQAIEQMRRFSKGITDFRMRLYWDEFKNLVLPVPPANEVAEMLSRISDMERQFGSLEREAESAITLLQERRSALISAAVTGQIDVRNVVATEVA